MNLPRWAVALIVLALLGLAWRALGWGGVALVVGGVVMWVLLHFTRITTVLHRAGQRPIGYVDSAVMLNARLRPGVTLLHVLALTRALGERLSPEGQQPEVFRWSDAGGSHVTAEFAQGRLKRWQLWRPGSEPSSTAPSADAPAASGSA